MKRIVVLVVALAMMAFGIFTSSSPALAENNTGHHFVKGKIIAVESCYSNGTKITSLCLGIIESNGSKHTAKISGDVRLDHTAYLECNTENGFTECNKDWNTSVGETYLQGGEITQ